MRNATYAALQTYDIVSNGEGQKVTVYAWTNDDQDRGWPNDDASWELVFDNVEKALKHTGTSRVGVSGVKVEVRLNGEVI